MSLEPSYWHFVLLYSAPVPFLPVGGAMEQVEFWVFLRLIKRSTNFYQGTMASLRFKVMENKTPFSKLHILHIVFKHFFFILLHSCTCIFCFLV